MERRHRSIVLGALAAECVALLAFVGLEVFAQRTADHYTKACGLTGTASSVVADVYDDASPATPLDTIPNGEIDRIGSTTCYIANLATTTATIAYPASGDATEHHYTVVFRDDAGNFVGADEVIAGIVGALEISGFCHDQEPVYPTQTVPARGITQTVINAGKASHIEHRFACDLDFANPDALFYQVFSYDSAGRVSDSTVSLTEPSPF